MFLFSFLFVDNLSQRKSFLYSLQVIYLVDKGLFFSNVGRRCSNVQVHTFKL